MTTYRATTEVARAAEMTRKTAILYWIQNKLEQRIQQQRSECRTSIVASSIDHHRAFADARIQN